MKLSIEWNALNDFSTVAPEGGAKIVEWDPGESRHHPIGNAAGQAACEPMVSPLRSPPAHNVVAFR